MRKHQKEVNARSLRKIMTDGKTTTYQTKVKQEY